MSRTNWRDPTDYEALRAADVATLAGEFLKRNPDYRAGRERLVCLLAQGRLTTAQLDNFALAWGLRFRGGRRVSELDPAGFVDCRRRSCNTGGTGWTFLSR